MSADVCASAGAPVSLLLMILPWKLFDRFHNHAQFNWPIDGECRWQKGWLAGWLAGRQTSTFSPLSFRIICVNRELNTNQNRLFESFEKLNRVWTAMHEEMLVSMHRTLISLILCIHDVCLDGLNYWLFDCYWLILMPTKPQTKRISNQKKIIIQTFAMARAMV